MKDSWSRAIGLASLAITLAVAIGGWLAADRIAEQGNEIQRQLADKESILKQHVSEQSNLSQQAIASQTNLTQADIAKWNVQRDYVQLAVNILRDEPSKSSQPLREFAVEILALNAPVKLTPAMRNALLSEKLKVPPSGGFSPSAFDSRSFGDGFLPSGYLPDGYHPPGWQPDGRQPSGTKPAEKVK